MKYVGAVVLLAVVGVVCWKLAGDRGYSVGYAAATAVEQPKIDVLSAGVAYQRNCIEKLKRDGPPQGAVKHIQLLVAGTTIYNEPSSIAEALGYLTSATFGSVATCDSDAGLDAFTSDDMSRWSKPLLDALNSL